MNNFLRKQRLLRELGIVLGLALLIPVLLWTGGFGQRTIHDPSFSTFVSPPTLSQDGGFYDEPFYLELSVPSGTVVYYTLDGSRPTASSARYDSPIYVYDRSAEPNRYRSIPNVTKYYLKTWLEPDIVDKCFVVRAMAMDRRGSCSAIVTASYFIDQPEYRDATVISLVADPEDLFGGKGIYVTGSDYDAWYQQQDKNSEPVFEEAPPINFFQKGADWEREANIELFSAENLPVNQKVGIRISGSSSRYAEIKRFSVYAREKYSGRSRFDHSFFGTAPEHSLVIRDGDLNGFCELLCPERDVLTMPVIPVRFFLNGEYWCDTYLCQRISEEDIAVRCSLLSSNIALSEWYKPSSSRDLGIKPFSDFISALKKDMSDSENYREFGRLADIQSYIDYSCIQVFMANIDYTDSKNVVYWHTIFPEDSGFGDGKWRWALYDMDLLWNTLAEEFGEVAPYEIDPFTMYARQIGTSLSEARIYSALRKNEDFCRDFVLTFADLLNTDFLPERTLALADRFPENTELKTFLELRPTYVKRFLAEEFDLAEEAELSLSVNDPQCGTIRLNTITPDLSEGMWTGYYFTDYPVTLSAEAKEGYAFAGWEVNGVHFPEAQIEAAILPGGTSVSASFVKQ